MRTAANAPEDSLELVLDRPACLELLDRCGAASLACTANALPSVLPVTVRVTSSAILIGADARADTHRLTGQIVAIGAGVAATPRSGGWWVVVRGELREDGAAGTFVLEPYEIEGRALPGYGHGGWWRC
jgi:hypothetical protein